MSRTAHHIPPARTRFAVQRREQRDALAWHPYGGPWRRVDLRSLRYSAAELRTAAKEGRRPQPREVRRAFDSWRYCCAFAGSLSEAAHLAERAARARARAACRAALHDPDTVIEPYRPRYGVHWEA
ncbi:hypothetical protein OHA37_27535 [Streptomyces sp. NBC_00335]|uniref:hypothetical protein n=1 Tax=unclassified Streptomyces TaxID=2593676 RepID=UPI00224E49E0|nr:MULTISPECIES: hypothetical protein [unclassified Streptomyces]MCX5407603.1 hypothetical protein [Streptomyces sp. NBC_00086]